jgi:hypothetical protein
LESLLQYMASPGSQLLTPHTRDARLPGGSCVYLDVFFSHGALLTFYLGWPPTMTLWISDSRVAGITGVNHCACLIWGFSVDLSTHEVSDALAVARNHKRKF